MLAHLAEEVAEGTHFLSQSAPYGAAAAVLVLVLLVEHLLAMGAVMVGKAALRVVELVVIPVTEEWAVLVA